MEAIVAALIAATASVIVALIGRRQQTSSSIDPALAAKSRERIYVATRTWLLPVSAIALWLVLSAIFIGYQIADANFFVIPVAALLVAVVFPIRPLLASAFVCLAYAVYYFMLPISFGIHHPEEANRMNIYGSMSLFGWTLRLGLTFIGAVLAGLACKWRAIRPPAVSAVPPAPGVTAASYPAINELERLSALHERGLLTDDEFTALKRRLLLDHSKQG